MQTQSKQTILSTIGANIERHRKRHDGARQTFEDNVRKRDARAKKRADMLAYLDEREETIVARLGVIIGSAGNREAQLHIREVERSPETDEEQEVVPGGKVEMHETTFFCEPWLYPSGLLAEKPAPLDRDAFDALAAWVIIKTDGKVKVRLESNLPEAEGTDYAFGREQVILEW